MTTSGQAAACSAWPDVVMIERSTRRRKAGLGFACSRSLRAGRTIAPPPICTVIRLAVAVSVSAESNPTAPSYPIEAVSTSRPSCMTVTTEIAELLGK